MAMNTALTVTLTVTVIVTRIATLRNGHGLLYAPRLWHGPGDSGHLGETKKRDMETTARREAPLAQTN